MDENRMVINFDLPNSWEDLSQKQLKFVFKILASGVSESQLMSLCLIKWSGLKVLGKSEKKDLYSMVKDKVFFQISPSDLYDVANHLSFLASPPKYPVIINRLGRHKAVSPVLQGLPLERFIFLDALWHSYMDSKNDDLVLDMVSVLYGFRPKRLKDFVKVAVIWWMSSLYSALTRFFPDLFRQSGSSDGTGSLSGDSQNYAESINTLIRALTKGDVCKEKEVMEIEVWRALTELNAQAKEYAEMQSKIKSMNNGK